MFEPNEYFTNPVLTKEYFIRFTVEDDNPLGYEGPDIVRCTGSVSPIHNNNNNIINLIPSAHDVKEISN